ncbi:MAG: DUF3570 domain-containing protein [Bacteroidales bacterium]|nr:DUF3570 domain-containing protein [Bacteroidales bacterium]
MKRRYLVIGMLAMALKGKPQASDQPFQKREIPKTDIEVLFSFYNQDGDHSAVTGGTGTEKLNVYAPGFNLDFQKIKSKIGFSGGVDIISSASTDKIDFVESSASLVDHRVHADFDYAHQIGNKDMVAGVGTGMSFESDYFSIPVRASFNYTTPSKMQQVSAAASVYFDDLRWGRRVGPGITPPETLIYPSELRYKEWYNTHNRYTYNLKTGFEQVINKRLVAAIYPELIIQRGLLATPFHRVYFTNDSVRVENFPDKKTRFPIGAKARYFAGNKMVIKGGYNFYSDDFGITAHGIDLEIAVKVSPLVTLSPFVRGYSQTASRFFKPYGQHDPSSRYYTSDYDNSAFRSVKAGLGFRWAPFGYFSKNGIFNEVNIRYAAFFRSDGLSAHMVSAAFSLSRLKKTDTTPGQ